jgi:prepilin-type N-terminal cleavage/methylation domain-containing protein
VKNSLGESEHGFTLVEMLVVLAVTGLMSGLMLVMMGQFRSIIKVDSSISEQAALQKTANYIAAQVEQTQALPLDLNQDGTVQFLQSQGNTLRFLAVSNRSDANYGLLEYSYGIEGADGTNKLVEVRRPRRLNVRDAAPNKITLLENITNLSFSFLQTASTDAAPTGDDKPTWLANPPTGPDLPAAIRIVIEKQRNGEDKIQASAIAYTAR